MMKKVLKFLFISTIILLVHGCGTSETPQEVVAKYYNSLCNQQFEEFASKLSLHGDRQEVFDIKYNEFVSFFSNGATNQDKEMLNGLFEINELTEEFSDDKKRAIVSYKLVCGGNGPFDVQATLQKGEEGWKITPVNGVLDFLGFEDAIKFMPSRDNSLSVEDLNTYQKQYKQTDYLKPIQEAAQTNLFDKILNRYKRPRQGTYDKAVVIDAEEFGRFKEGLCSFRRGKFWGFMDVDGNIVIEPKLHFPEYPTQYYNDKNIDFPFFSYGLCLVYNEAGWPMYINKKGEVKIDGTYMFREAAPFVGNYANIGLVKLRPRNSYSLKDQRKYETFLNCTIDRNGIVRNEMYKGEVLGGMIARAYLPVEGLNVFTNDEGLKGFYDINKRVVLPAKYTAVQHFSEGLAWVEMKDDYGRKKWGVIDKTGAVKINFIYDEMPNDFHCGRAAVKPKERNCIADFIDAKGDKIFSTKYGVFSDKKAFEMGLLGDKDIDGNTIMSLETAHDFPIKKLQLFAPDFNWDDSKIDEIFYTDIAKNDNEIGWLDNDFGKDFVYQNKRLFCYGKTDDNILFCGFRGADGDFKIIRYR